MTEYGNVSAPTPAAAAAGAPGQAPDEQKVLRGIVMYATLMGFLSLLLLGAHRAYVRWNVEDGTPSSAARMEGIARILRLSYLSTMWFTISVSLSLFNKFVYSFWNGGKYRYPVTLVTAHLAVKFFLASIIMVRRGDVQRERPSCKLYFSRLFIIGIMTGADIGFNNWAVMESAVSFVSVIRSMGVLATLSLSACMGLVRCNMKLLAAILVIITGSFLAVWKEPEFKFIGAVLALAALATGCIRWVFTQTVMQKEKMGIVPTIFFSSPSAIASVFIMALIFELPRMRIDGVRFSWSFLVDMTFAGCVGGVFAFLLLAVEFELIRVTSAVSTEVISKIKTMTLLVMTVAANGERMNAVNVVGMVTISIGTVMYACIKQHMSVDEEGSVEEGQQQSHRKNIKYSRVLQSVEEEDG